MDISEAIDSEFLSFDMGTPVAKLRGAFTDQRRKAVIITNQDEVGGVVTRRDIISSHEPSSRKAGSLVRSVPDLDSDEDVREAARLFLTADSSLLPVTDIDGVVGVLRADDLLELVHESLHALTASDVMTREVVSLTPTTSLGRTLSTFRENNVRHLPVVESGENRIVGLVSLYDVLNFVTRELQRSQGGQPDESMGASVGAHHGGFGAREGERDDLLELPVRNVMTEPVVSVASDDTLDGVLGVMEENHTSSVIVSDPDDTLGIVTKTDILESLTWEDEPPYYIHVFGSEFMSETTWEELSDRIEAIVRKDRSLGLLEAKVHFHHHKERLRGRPYVLARVRLFTDKGTFLGSGEGFGDRHAFSLALDVVERQILEAKDEDRPRASVADLASASYTPGEWE